MLFTSSKRVMIRDMFDRSPQQKGFRRVPAGGRGGWIAFSTAPMLNGLMLIFPDDAEGLSMFGSEILPQKRMVFS